MTPAMQQSARVSIPAPTSALAMVPISNQRRSVNRASRHSGNSNRESGLISGASAPIALRKESAASLLSGTEPTTR